MAFNHSLEAVISPPVHRLDIREFAMLNPESRVDPNAPTRLNEEITGAGLFLHISLKPTAIALAGEPSLRFGDVNANCLDLKNGARFLLFVDKGLLSLLEAYSYEESWPPPTSSLLAFADPRFRPLVLERGWQTEGCLRDAKPNFKASVLPKTCQAGTGPGKIAFGLKF